MGGSIARLRFAVVSIAALALSLTSLDAARAQPTGDEEVVVDGGDEPAPDGGAPALDPEEAKVAARKLLDGGDGFLKKGDQLAKRKKAAEAAAQYERALAAYQKAYELVPNAQILFPIAVAEEKLAQWPDAARDFRRFLTLVPDADPKLRADAERRLETAKLQVGVLALVITPDGTQVSLDDQPVGTSPLADPLYLAAGEYKLAFAADGYQPLEQRVAIEVGSESERTFELQPIPIVVETPRPRPPPPPAVVLPPPPSKLPLVLAGGLTVGLAAGATTFGLLAIGKHSTFADESVPYAEREDARTSGKRMALLADGLLVGTVVAAGVTAYYYFKIYQPKVKARAARQREQRQQFDEFAHVPRAHGPGPASQSLAPKVLVTPWVERSAGGVVLTGNL